MCNSKIMEVQLNLDKKGESLIDKVPNLKISEMDKIHRQRPYNSVILQTSEETQADHRFTLNILLRHKYITLKT